MIIAGVEEAGRGPVIGPLVMAIYTIEASREKILTIEGVMDSKKLTPVKRKQLYDMLIKSGMEFEIISISAKEVDAALDDPKSNLNMLEAITSAKLIDCVTCAKAILDCPTHDTLKYAKTVKKMLKNDVEVIAEHKADVNHPVVSAASILAKVERDREIELLKKEYDVDFGSGYPSDPLTQKFIEENFDNPKYEKLFRKNWDTFKRLVEKKNQKSLFDF